MIANTNKTSKKILLTGGGTGGSVSPLLAIVQDLSNLEFLWVGTKDGPERIMIEKEGVKFKSIYGGKLRRYFSLKNFIDPFLVLIGFILSFFIILKWKPNLIISAGSFISVPVVWAGWILRVPILIHQQDARPGLANRLMAIFAKTITVTFKESLEYYGKKAVWTGSPVRQSLTSHNTFNLKNDLPVVLVIGGGTGAMAINELIWKGLDELTKFCQIIHVIGKNKGGSTSNLEVEPPCYKSFEFLTAEQMAEAYAAADIVVSRCGMGVLTELSYLGKPSILIPIPNSHQEDNAKIFKDKEAAIVLNQRKLTSKELIQNIKKLLDDELLRSKMRNNIGKVMKRGANEKIAEIIKNILI